MSIWYFIVYYDIIHNYIVVVPLKCLFIVLFVSHCQSMFIAEIKSSRVIIVAWLLLLLLIVFSFEFLLLVWICSDILTKHKFMFIPYHPSPYFPSLLWFYFIFIFIYCLVWWHMLIWYHKIWELLITTQQTEDKWMLIKQINMKIT